MSVTVHQAYEHLPQKQLNQIPDVGGWSFLQALCDTKSILRNREDDDGDSNKTPYIHPIEKRSKAKLSFEMCTESLGTENGSESGDEIILLALEATNDISQKIQPLTTKPHKEEEESKFITVRENRFPPPLNSVNGINRMVKSYGEDGRLVVQAIRVCSAPRCFVSERSEGRLRLCLSENSSLSQDHGDEEFEENESEFEACDEDEEDAEEEEEEEEEGNFEYNENFEGEIGNKNFRRTWRCNESGSEAKTMLNWKQQQFWVAT